MTQSKENNPQGTPLLGRGRGRLIIVSAPSGSGKSTIVQWLMKEHPELSLYFSISCTSRAPRGTEQNGVEYFFLTPEEFKAKIQDDEFLEYEEVYQDRFYGTLKAQVELEGRATDTPEAIAERLAKAEYEMTFASQFDHIIVNDDLETAKQETLNIVKAFLG